MEFDKLLRLMVEKGASDLFVTAGVPPSMKVNGQVIPVTKNPLSPEKTRELVLSVMTDKQRVEFHDTQECNFAVSARGIGRFRCSAFHQRNLAGMVLRRIETRIPLLDLEMVELVKTLPLGVRFHATEPKRLLKKALSHYLEQSAPQAVAALGPYKKMGFEVPTTSWINGAHFGPVMDAVLSPAAVKRAGFFKPAYIASKLEAQRTGKANNERGLPTAMAVQQFLL